MERCREEKILDKDITKNKLDRDDGFSLKNDVAYKELVKQKFSQLFN